MEVIVDWNRLETLQQTDDEDDIAWMKDMVVAVIQNIETRLSNLNEHLEKRKIEDMLSELHQTKGVAANFGLDRLRAATLKAETLLKQGDEEAGIDACSPLSSIWNETKLELEKKFGKVNTEN